jgi:hypothetical protein
VLKLMFAALIRAAERWRGLRFTEFELRQIAAVQKDLDTEYEATIARSDRRAQTRFSSTSQPWPLENAADARRQRILVSRSEVHAVKWLCLILQAICALVATAMVHSDNRLASAVTLAMFATGVAASILLIASHDRPFTGDISVGPDPLVQVMPADSEK